MEEHVGKKRRKELRYASNLRRDKNKMWLKVIGLFVLGMVIIGVSNTVIIFRAYDTGGNFQILQALPLLLAFALVVFLGSQTTKIYDLRREFKEYCAKHSITREDIKAFDKES